MTANEARHLFIEYFTKHQHQHVRSSSLVPQDDPTLLFTNAGMVQFKRVFMGEDKRAYTTAVTSQKCVRAGGKHNDLDNVGYTARHHTFFEMLGNFSFGDYFKSRAIAFAWDLLTNGYGLPKDKLWVSVYQDDDEAYNLWRDEQGVPESRIVRLGEDDNFWAMGDTGPCGPCSEIHIDRGPEFGCDRPDCAVGCECDRYLEIWNLVFMQYYRDETGSMTPLPKPSIDTGMGLERIVSVIQNAPTNYETDLFMPIMKQLEVLTGKKLGSDPKVDVAMKVIADHSRATTFLIADGVLPSNDGKGYVLRRIMRRAIRYGRHLGLDKPFLDVTAKVVMDIMADAYPELKASEHFIVNVITNEEHRFSETLDHGLKLLNETLGTLRAEKQKKIPGEVIFKLYDTFGFPVDIIQDITAGSDIQMDMDGFETCMDAQREQSKGKVTFSESAAAFKALTSQGVETVFTGYEHTTGTSEILLLVSGGEGRTTVAAGEAVEIVTRKTPFYAEAGGQVGDTGEITHADTGARIVISGTLKDPNGLTIHRGTVDSGRFSTGDTVTLTVDTEARVATARNHTATHILHAVLQEVLGDHVKQAGSLVTPERLRFDFSHFSSVTPEELKHIEHRVNERVRMNVAVETQEMSIEDATQSGATALFGEKYGDWVRVVSLPPFSMEFCGGTHATRTGDIGLFKIVSESSIAAGVRRIEAVTGAPAISQLQATETLLSDAAGLVKEAPHGLAERIEKLLSTQKQLEKELEALKADRAAASLDDLDQDIRTAGNVSMVTKVVAVDSPAELRNLADKFKDRLQSGVVVLGAPSGGKALLIAIVTKDLIPTFHAGNIVKAAAKKVGGGGGGRPDMAQAGGSKPERLEAALATAAAMITEIATS
ncbi:MAG: alanine--tRNA ligase [Deltaproteobacteria bacterium]|nr:MAG: alanine--tRNA ligase [Deltaproteobacteria bacterium]